MTRRDPGNDAAMPSVLVLLPGGTGRVTGGNVYDRVVIDGMRARGWTVEVRDPGDLTGPWDVVVVDSQAFRLGRPQTDIPYVALAHQLPSAASRKSKF